MNIEKRYGIPIVDRTTVFPYLKNIGVTLWPLLEGPIPIEEYVQRELSPEAQAEIKRFAPKADVVIHRDPHGAPFVGFRTIGKIGTLVFILLPGDLVVICAEYKHAANILSLIPPGGMVRRDEDPAVAARREVTEETGVVLDDVVALARYGIPENPRLTNGTVFPFLGVLPQPPVFQPPRVSAREPLTRLLIPLGEWLALIEGGLVQDGMSVITTHLALRKIGRLALVPAKGEG